MQGGAGTVDIAGVQPHCHSICHGHGQNENITRQRNAAALRLAALIFLDQQRNSASHSLLHCLYYFHGTNLRY